MDRISWYKVPHSEEIVEFDRVVTTFTPTHLDNKPIPNKFYHKYWDAKLIELQTLYARASAINLTNTIWRSLENTDSYGTDTMDKIRKAIKSNREVSGDRSIQSIDSEFKSLSVRLPIILSYSFDRFNLIGGNIRLMYCKYTKITPRVIVIKTNW